MLIRYVFRVLWFLLFLLMLGFAIKNSETVTINYYLGFSWQAPLVLALLIAFIGGVVAGVFASLGFIFRQKRNILSLKKELRSKGQDLTTQSE